MTNPGARRSGADDGQDPDAFGVGRLFWITSEAIVAADLELGVIVLWNPAAARLFGYPAAEALGMPLERLVPDSLRQRHLSGISRYFETGEAVLVGGPPIDVPATTKRGGALDVALSLSDVTDSGSRRYVLAVIRDMTQVRQAERESQQSMDAMRDFVATASHDLRTPLTSVLGFATSLLESGDCLAVEERQSFLEAIVRGASTASRLVGDLLTLSQLTAGVPPTHPTDTGVAAVAKEAVLHSGVDATIEIDEHLTVRVDAHHLERVLVNYLTNAARHGQPPVSVTAERQGVTVAIGVRDHGPGVPREFVSRLFTSFARAETASAGGTGLGLSIVHGLAVANGGEAYHEATSGGTCFGIRLPSGAPAT